MSVSIVSTYASSSFFTNAAAKATMKTAYQSLLDTLPTSYELLSLETSAGQTNIVRLGPSDGTPLLLLHARHSCAPLILHQYAELLTQFRVYAIDLPGQPNLSAEVRLSVSTDAYGQWMFEILTRLGIWHATLVGVDLGAFVALKSLVFDERRIAAAYLIAPLGVHTEVWWRQYWYLQRPLQRFVRRRQVRHLHQLADVLWKEYDQETLTYWKAVLPGYSPDKNKMPSLAYSATRRIKTPVYCFAGNQDWYFTNRNWSTIAQKLLPSLECCVTLKNSKHFPSATDTDLIVDCIKTTSHAYRTTPGSLASPKR